MRPHRLHQRNRRFRDLLRMLQVHRSPRGLFQAREGLLIAMESVEVVDFLRHRERVPRLHALPGPQCFQIGFVSSGCSRSVIRSRAFIFPTRASSCAPGCAWRRYRFPGRRYFGPTRISISQYAAQAAGLLSRLATSANNSTACRLSAASNPAPISIREFAGEVRAGERDRVPRYQSNSCRCSPEAPRSSLRRSVPRPLLL